MTLPGLFIMILPGLYMLGLPITRTTLPPNPQSFSIQYKVAIEEDEFYKEKEEAAA